VGKLLSMRAVLFHAIRIEGATAAKWVGGRGILYDDARVAY
jgi:hypothetical protein